MRTNGVGRFFTPALTTFEEGDNLNARQRRVLVENGATRLEELTSPASRLAFANAAPVVARLDPLEAHRPVLDPGKINAAGLSTTRRLEVAEDVETVARTLLETKNGVTQRSTTDADCAAALARLRPFLKEES